MPSYFDRYKSNHKAKDLCDIVYDVKKYPEFLPWISGARISNEQENSFEAELIIAFKAFSHQYTSKVTKHEPDERNAHYEIKVTQTKGPFKMLDTCWVFNQLSDSETEIIFEMKYEFKSIIFEKLVGRFFESAAKKTTKAFQDRAKQLLG